MPSFNLNNPDDYLALLLNFDENRYQQNYVQKNQENNRQGWNSMGMSRQTAYDMANAGSRSSSRGGASDDSWQKDLGLAELAWKREDSAADRALQRELANLQMQSARAQADATRQVGMANVALGDRRIALDRMLGERDQALEAQKQLATRATRQLAAPQGRINPGLAPILGRDRI